MKKVKKQTFEISIWVKKWQVHFFKCVLALQEVLFFLDETNICAEGVTLS